MKDIEKIDKIRGIVNSENIEIKDMLNLIKKTLFSDISERHNHTNDPKLNHPDDVYYTGTGCTWGTDLRGKRYDKLYHPNITGSKYSHLNIGDIICEKTRVGNIVISILKSI